MSTSVSCNSRVPAQRRKKTLTAVRRRIPGPMCGHHFAKVFFNASSRTPLGFSHATYSST